MKTPFEDKNWNPIKDFKISEKALCAPIDNETPTVYFMGIKNDLFYMSFEDINKIMAIVAVCPQHTFQILTKRPQIMQKYFESQFGEIVNIVDGKISRFTHPLPNLHLGYSINESNELPDIHYLLETPATVRFINYEYATHVDIREYLWNTDKHYCEMCGNPATKPCDFDFYPIKTPNKDCEIVKKNKIKFVMVGGERTRNDSPLHPGWVRLVEKQCEETGTQFFSKAKIEP